MSLFYVLKIFYSFVKLFFVIFFSYIFFFLQFHTLCHLNKFVIYMTCIYVYIMNTVHGYKEIP